MSTQNLYTGGDWIPYPLSTLGYREAELNIEDSRDAEEFMGRKQPPAGLGPAGGLRPVVPFLIPDLRKLLRDLT